MIITKDFKLREVAHGHGDNGFSFQEYLDTEGLGVRCMSRRESHGVPYFTTWSFDWLAGQSFNTLDALIAAVATVTDEEIAAEKAMYPYVRTVTRIEGKGYPNRCRACAWGTERKPANVMVHIATNWQPSNDRFTGLCAEHEGMQGNAVALLAALDADVEARRAARAARGFL